MIGNGARHLRQPHGQVAAEARMEHEAAVDAGEHHLGVVFRQNLEVDYLPSSADGSEPRGAESRRGRSSAAQFTSDSRWRSNLRASCDGSYTLTCAAQKRARHEPRRGVTAQRGGAPAAGGCR